MDVLGILRENGKDLLPEEMDLLQTELDTGGYDAEYIAACRKLISELKNWSVNGLLREDRVKYTEVQVPEEQTPEAIGEKETNVIQSFSNVSAEDMVTPDLQRMRTDRDYRSLFKNYVKESSVINEEFVSAHFSLFREPEVSVLLSCIHFSEEFLERYFSSLDPKAIALHQRFSENFFIKHYADLDAVTVLTKGVNSWRIKTLRSKMLSNFLRIKGVKV